MKPTSAFPSVRSLIAVPAVLTLAVTLVRLGLEFGGAPRWLASADAGGAGALLGIVWLPLVFGPWFAFRLAPYAATTKALLLRLAKTLWVYGLAARVPVFLLTIPAVLGQWGTHYDKFPFEAGSLAKIAVGFGAQIVFWASVWTVATGFLAGLLALAVTGHFGASARRARSTSAA